MENNFLLKIKGLNREQLFDVCVKSFTDGKEQFEKLAKMRSEVLLGDDTIDFIFDGAEERHCIGNTNDKGFQEYITILEMQYVLSGVNVIIRTYDEFIEEINELSEEDDD